MAVVSELRKVPRVVWGLGLVSLLTDAAADMVVPLLPALLERVGGGPRSLGVLEGLAEATSALFKLGGGVLSDRGVSSRVLIVGGYGVAALARPLYSVASAPWHAFGLRSLDRLGKGLRSAPRDAAIAESVRPEQRSLAFAVHRGMDNRGAVVGGLTSFVLLAIFEWSLDRVLLASVVPGLLSTAVAAWVLRARNGDALPARESATVVEADPELEEPPARSRKVAGLLALATWFSLACSADTFLLAHLAVQGLALPLVPLVWVGLQLLKSLLNGPGGLIADRTGPARATVIAWIIYGAAYLGFAASPSVGVTIALLVLYAAFYGIGEGAEKALVVEVAPRTGRGKTLGLFHALTGLGAFVANVAFGFVYAVAPTYAFATTAAIALTAAAGLAAWRASLGTTQARDSPSSRP
jgi:sugar phosphate permease